MSSIYKASISNLDADVARRFRDAAEYVRVLLDAPGLVAAAVMPDGTLRRTAVGIADKENAVVMREESRMPGGSTGKSVFAATASLLAAEGIVNFDDPLSKWLGHEPWFARLPNAAEISLRHLLMHTSGVPDH